MTASNPVTATSKSPIRTRNKRRERKKKECTRTKPMRRRRRSEKRKTKSRESSRAKPRSRTHLFIAGRQGMLRDPSGAPSRDRVPETSAERWLFARPRKKRETLPRCRNLDPDRREGQGPALGQPSLARRHAAPLSWPMTSEPRRASGASRTWTTVISRWNPSSP